MPFEPISPVGGFTATPELPRPSEDTGPDPTTSQAFGAAFRTENTIGSIMAARDSGFAGRPLDTNFDPWGEIADTPYEAYGDNFAGARDKEHFEALKADIDRENKDRDILSRSGWTGFGASLAAGGLDWPTLLPGGAILRTAKGATSILRSAASVGAYGAAGAALSEGVLQGTQQLRTAEESAMVIGGSAILAGALGAGLAKYVARGDLARLGGRVERDFEVPGVGQLDAFEPGSLRPSVEAASGAGDAARAVADSIRETAEAILPPQVRVQVVDTLGAPGGDGRFGLRGGYAKTPAMENDIRRKITEVLEADDGYHYGLRITERPLTVGETAPPSKTFYNDFISEDHDTFGREAFPDHGEDLPGASAVGIRSADDIDAALQAAGVIKNGKSRPFGSSTYFGDHVSLVRSRRQIGGSDPGEWILPDAEVVATWSKSSPGTPSEGSLSLKGAPGDDGLYAIRAFHATRHDFDRFDMGNIGTGDGAQVYGHGLYFAENKVVGTKLQEQFGEIRIDGKPVADSYEQIAATLKLEGRIDDFINNWQRNLARAEAAGDGIGAEEARAALAMAERVKRGDVKKVGNLYEVDIDVEPRQLLDHDATLGDQPEMLAKVAPLLERVGSDVTPETLRTQPGSWVRSELEAHLGSPDAASAALREAGVPGMRYLDEDPRDAAGGTRNIVIFDDSLVKITGKNGEPVTAAERQVIVDQMFSLRGFYSPAIRAAQAISMKKGTGEQFWKQITKAAGVRKDELEWMGLQEFLAGKPSTTKDEVLAFMQAHQVELDEKVLGDFSGTETKLEAINEEDAAGRGYDAGTAMHPHEEYWSVRADDAEFIIAKRRGVQVYDLFDPKDGRDFATHSLSEAQHIAAGWHGADRGGGEVRFAPHKVPGGENYRELLIRLPSLEGKYTSKHFQDQEIVHIRVDDRTGPNGEKVLFINEVQSDLHQAGRQKGYETTPQERIRQGIERGEVETDIGGAYVRALDRGTTVDRLLAESTLEERMQLRGLLTAAVPKAPFKGDLWLELGLKRALRYAAENDYDAISWARSDQIAKAVGAQPEKLALQYDQKIGKFLDKYTAKWGGKVEEGLDIDSARQPQRRAHAQAVAGWLGDLGGDSARRLVADAEKNALNDLVRITPDMRASVMAGQPFGVRQTPTGAVAEGRFDPQTLLITIAADALDPAKTLRHESIHALKQMGLFAGREWQTLEAAAKAKGWIESNNVRQLYEGVYKDRITDELLAEEAIAEQFSLWRQGAAQFDSIITALFQRIQAFLERTGNALRGRGFQTAESVFASVRSGDVAARAQPTAPSPGALAAAGSSGRATSVGASAVHRADDTLKSAFGMEKAMAFQDPMLRLQTSPSPVSRRYVQELAETPLMYEKNAAGDETAPGGSEMGAPGAVETRMKFWQAPFAESMQGVDNAFLLYRKGRAKRFVGEVPALTMKDTLFGTDALTYREFKGEISKALRRGDENQIPEVAGVARIIRQKVLDPLKDAAIAEKMLPEGVTPETADSYLNRLYNKDRIIAERDQFKTVVSDWLEGQETINRGVRTRLTPLLEQVDTADADTAKLEARIPKREARLKEIEARAEEAGRVQQFAFKRALERREPIEQLRQQISDLTDQIAEPLDRLAALKEAAADVKAARDIITANAEGDGQSGDLADQITDAGDLDEHLAKVIADAEASIERMAEAGDLPAAKVEGRYEGPALSYDEIDDVARSWQFAKEMRARRKPESLTSFVVRMGGVEDPGGDVLSMIGRKKDRPGLIRKGPDDQGPQLPIGGAGRDRASSLDAMALRAQENGFFADKTERPTINELLDALRDDLAHGNVVRTEDQGYFEDLARAGQAESDLRERGLGLDKFKTEGQVRLFLGQSPSDAFRGEANANIRALKAVRQQLSEMIGPYRDRISAQTKDARRKERAESLRQSERGVFATQSRARRRTLADQTFERRGELEKIRADLERKQARLLDAQKAIEEEVTKYQGKSAKDAKSALEAREEADLLREEKRQAAITRRGELQALIAGEEQALTARGANAAPDPQRLLSLKSARDELAELEKAAADPKRLRGADKPVLTAARKIAAQLDKEPGEIGDLADEIIDRILGTPDGRLPYDAHGTGERTSFGGQTDKRGPLAARVFMIPDAAIERWLENDVETLLRAYTRTMAADVEITKRFGSVEMTQQIKEITEDYARRSAAATTPAERKKLHKQRGADIEDLAAIRDRLRGTYNLPSNPDGFLVRAGRVVSSLNYMRMLGGMTLSAIPDVGGIVFSHGMLRVFGDGLVPLLRNWTGARIAMTEVKMAGTALDMVLDSRAMQIADVMDEFGRHSKFERAVSSAARNFGVVSLQAPWNAAMKQFAGLVTMTRMLRAMEQLGSGKAAPQEIERLAASGISEANARRIAEQFAKHGKKGGGVWFANTAEWDAGSRAAIEAFRAGLVRDVDRIIISPGQDRPLWMSSELGRLVGQFKSFAIAAMQRVVIAGLQQRDGATLSGAALMTALGGLSGILKAKVAGQPGHTEWDDPKKNAQFLVEAIDRSGLTGWLMEANAMTEKLSRGAVGLSAITGKPVSRFAQRNIMGSLLGPTAGTAQDFIRIAGSASSGEWNQSDSRAMRRLIPYNNIFYARKMFDEAEAGINDFLGVPKPAGAKR